jgi:hypothetical protein
MFREARIQQFEHTNQACGGKPTMKQEYLDAAGEIFNLAIEAENNRGPEFGVIPIAQIIASHVPSEREPDTTQELTRLLNRVLRGVKEFEPDTKAVCALWQGGADSDGCGACFKCFEADLAEAITLIPSDRQWREGSTKTGE